MHEKDGIVRMLIEIPTRGLLGYRGQFVVDTRGEGILASRFIGFKDYAGEIKKRDVGSMTSMINSGSNVSGVEIKKTLVNISLYEIYSGKTRMVKMWSNQFERNHFEVKDILYISSLDKKNKKEYTGEINQETGKKIYVDVEGKFEFWLSKYYVRDTISEVAY
jgi:predicted membrane GTPase involved in stress response